MSHDKRPDPLSFYSDRALLVHLVKTQAVHGASMAAMAKALEGIERKLPGGNTDDKDLQTAIRKLSVKADLTQIAVDETIADLEGGSNTNPSP